MMKEKGEDREKSTFHIYTFNNCWGGGFWVGGKKMWEGFVLPP